MHTAALDTIRHAVPNAPELSSVRRLAEYLRRPVSVFDLETTTVFGNTGLGILEYAVLTVPAYGDPSFRQGLVNPAMPIDPEIRELTGLTENQVAGAPHWPAAGAHVFEEIADRDLVCGFGIRHHDLPTLADQARRYQRPIPRFTLQLDLAEWYRYLSGKADSLASVAARFGIQPRGPLHRAGTDTLLAAELLDRMLLWYGIEDLFTSPVSSRKRRPQNTLPVAVNAESVYWVADHLAEHPYTGIGPIADALGISDFEASRLLIDALNAAVITPDQVALPAVQGWLDRVLPNAVDQEWADTGRRLKPLMSRLRMMRDCPDGLDYVQLQTALRRHAL